MLLFTFLLAKTKLYIDKVILVRIQKKNELKR